MDIAALSMTMSQAGLKQAVSISVTKVAMDSAKTQAQAMTEVMTGSAADQAARPNVGTVVDVSA